MLYDLIKFDILAHNKLQYKSDWKLIYLKSKKGYGMKRLIKFSTLFLFMFFASVGLVACEPKLEEIYVDESTIKTEYFVGETQETYENAVVYQKYSNGTEKVVEDKENITFSTISTLEVGTKTLTITYKEKTCDVEITVREKLVTGLTINGLKTSYVVDEVQDNSCTITATYEDGTTEVVDLANVTFSAISTEVVSTTQKIIVTYKNFSKDVAVNVAAKPVEGIRFVEGSVKNSYYQKDEFEGFSGAEVLIVYFDQTTEEIAFSDLTFTPNTISTDNVGEFEVTVSYLSYETTFEIVVLERILNGINIVETDLLTNYVAGDDVDNYSTLQVELLYSNDTSEIKALSSLTGASLTLPETSVAGNTSLVVNYEGFSDSVAVTVDTLVVEDLELTFNKDNYTKGSDEEILTNDVKVVMTYNGGKEKELNYDQLQNRNITLVGNGLIDSTFTKGGYVDVVATSGTVNSAPVQVTVYSVEHDKYYISQWASPEYITTYKSNIAIDSESDNGFYVNKNSAKFERYAIGDDNAFKFNPTVLGYASLTDFGAPTSIKKLMTYFRVWLLTELGEVELTDNLSQYVAIDEEKSELDFTDKAVGETFKIAVLPYFDRAENDPIYFEFDVKDGYNVYEAYELCLFDNVNFSVSDSTSSDYVGGRIEEGIWKEFKQEKGLWNVTTNGLYIHKNLTLDSTQVSKYHFYREGDLDLPKQEDSTYGETILNSLRDFSYIYRRNGGNHFEINGNYFTIDAGDFPLIAYFDGGNHKMTHTSLFWTEYETSTSYKNIKFIGNAQREDKGEGAGGLILAKICYGSEATFDNLLTLTFGITYFPQYGNAVVTVNDSKAFDNYSNFIYTYSKAKINVNHCYFTGCGGPIAILAHTSPDNNPDAYGELNIDETSTMINYVTGEEGWFKLLNCTGLVSGLKPLASMLQQASNKYKLNKTFLRTRPNSTVEEINLVALIMHSSSPLVGSKNPIKGKVTFGNSGVNLVDDLLHEAILSVNGNAPIMQGGGKTIFTDAQTGFYKINTTTQKTVAIDENDAPLFMDDFIGLSTKLTPTGSRAGALLGFFDIPKPETEEE